MKFTRFGFLAVVAAALLCSCASSNQGDDPASGYSEVSDPLEPLNRTVFGINLLLDDMLIRPLAETYDRLLPDFVQEGIRNLLRTARTPVDLANAMLQGDFDQAGNIAARTFLNVTGGAGGMFDIATDIGYPYRREDFGQTLAVWGAEPGFYLVLPLIGPSSGRDAPGLLVDTLLNPMTYFGGAVQTADITITLTRGLDQRAQELESVDDLRRDAVDFYARVRSLWEQNRIDEINNGEAGPVPTASPVDALEDEVTRSDDTPLDDRAEAGAGGAATAVKPIGLSRAPAEGAQAFPTAAARTWSLRRPD